MKVEFENIAMENLEIFENKKYMLGKTIISLTKSMEKMISETRIYSDDYRNGLNIPILFPVDEVDPSIIITKQDSFSAAIDQITNYKTSCVLNFASAKYPGGGFLGGAISQEEDLCRRSTLYAALVMQEELYDWSAKHLKGSIYSDWCVFTPSVIIFRNENYLMSSPAACSVITSPAPNKTAALLNKIVGKDDVEKAMRERCELILKVAAAEKKRNLVLGAFGCGVFGNDPYVVAKIWKDLLAKEKYGRYFKHITFAIKTGHDESNYNAFIKVFNEAR